MSSLYRFTLGITLGIGIAMCLPLGYTQYALVSILISLIALIVDKFYTQSLPPIVAFILACVLGMSWAYYHSSQRLNWKLDKNLIGKSIQVQGVVENLVLVKGHTLEFDGRVTQLCDSEQHCTAIKTRLHFFWPRYHQSLHTGEYFKAEVKIKPLKKTSNPGGLSFDRIYFIKGINASAHIHSLEVLNRTHSFNSILQSTRQKLYETLLIALDEQNYARMLIALTLGIKKTFSNQDWHILQRTGTSHLMAISGLHIGLIGGLFVILGTRISALILKPHALISSHLIGAWCGWGGSLIYCCLAGFSTPTLRAFIMISICVLMLTLKKGIGFTFLLCYTLIALAAVDVTAFYSEGLWLSVVAVFFLLALAQNPSQLSSFTLQLKLLVGMLPLGLWFFSAISFIAPLSNLFAIPLVGFIVVPMTLIGIGVSALSFKMAAVFFYIADKTFSLVWWGLTYLSKIPGYYEQNISLFGLISLFIGVGLVLLPKGMPLRWLGLVGLIPILFKSSPRPDNGEVWVDVLDVGQGLSVVIRTYQHTLLYDTGPDEGYSNAGERILLPFFRFEAIKKLDKVIISHNDADHIGGFRALTQAIVPKQVMGSDLNDLTGPWKSELCRSSQHWHWDGVDFLMLHPSNQSISSKKNENSCVLQIKVGEHRVLLTGDIEKKAEAELIRRYGDGLKSDVLIVPHHGSASSSTELFVKLVNPQYAVIPVGTNNRYHLPHSSILERYKLNGSKILETSQTGALRFKLGHGQTLPEPISWAAQNHYIWNHSK